LGAQCLAGDSSASDLEWGGMRVHGSVFRQIAIATITLGVAASLAGCAGPRPFSVEEALWFSRAVGHDVRATYQDPYTQPAYLSHGHAPSVYALPYR
jgi:hypothetical protein